MKLYTAPLSSSARRVNLTVAHLGIEIDQRLIDLRKPEDRVELVAVNPNGKIPALADPTNQLSLWESHAICQYLCDRNPVKGEELYPTSLIARADVNRWLFWVNAHLSPAVGPINFEKLWKKWVTPETPDPDPVVLARYERFLHQNLAVLEKHLIDRTWVVGKALTLADFSIASTLMYRASTQLTLDAYPRVLALLARVEQTPAWIATEPQKLG